MNEQWRPIPESPMKHGSLFAGVGGFDLGFERAGFKTAWQVEIEPFCRAVLERHFPDAERFEDIRDCGARNLKPVDCITAGVPCQDVSVAGKRAGLRGERTGLFYEFARILCELRPAWFVFENVPGLFSSNRGRDFAEVLRVPMVECGYGVCWRVLDSQFFGVAQRRRRVFIVGRFGKPCPPEVLFESACGAGDFAAGGEAGPDVAFALNASVSGVGGHGQGWNSNYVTANTLRESDGHRGDDCDNLICGPVKGASLSRRSVNSEEAASGYLVAATLNSGGASGGFRTEPGEHIVIQDVRGRRDKRQHGIGIQEGGPSYTLDGTSQHAIAFNIVGSGQQGRNHAYEAQRTGALQHKGNAASGNEAGTVVVCAPPDTDGMRDATRFSEGLDDSLLPKGLDSARYWALGNAVTVQVAEWIAGRIKACP